MAELDPRLREAYTLFKSTQPVEQPPRRIRNALRSNKQKWMDRLAAGVSSSIYNSSIAELENILKKKEGFYPLARICFTSSKYSVGFSYGFNYPVEEDIFQIDFNAAHGRFWSDGLPAVYSTQENPHIELRGVEMEGIRYVKPLAHLPKEFSIPVGPVYFDEDGNMYNQKTYDAHPSLYSARYFNWRPTLPHEPTRITIDFDSINWRSAALTPENVPTYGDTKFNRSY